MTEISTATSLMGNLHGMDYSLSYVITLQFHKPLEKGFSFIRIMLVFVNDLNNYLKNLDVFV